MDDEIQSFKEKISGINDILQSLPTNGLTNVTTGFSGKSNISLRVLRVHFLFKKLEKVIPKSKTRLCIDYNTIDETLPEGSPWKKPELFKTFEKVALEDARGTGVLAFNTEMEHNDNYIGAMYITVDSLRSGLRDIYDAYEACVDQNQTFCNKSLGVVSKISSVVRKVGLCLVAWSATEKVLTKNFDEDNQNMALGSTERLMGYSLYGAGILGEYFAGLVKGCNKRGECNVEKQKMYDAIEKMVTDFKQNKYCPQNDNR